MEYNVHHIPGQPIFLIHQNRLIDKKYRCKPPEASIFGNVQQSVSSPDFLGIMTSIAILDPSDKKGVGADIGAGGTDIANDPSKIQ